MKPNFQEMNRKELRAYVLANRNDDEAFRAYMEKLNAEANWVRCPPLKSTDDLDNYPEFLEKVRINNANLPLDGGGL